MKHKNERKVDKIGEDGASQEKKEKSTKKRKKFVKVQIRGKVAHTHTTLQQRIVNIYY